MNKILKIAIWPIILVPAIYLAVVWRSLPEKVAMHFDFSGTPDRFGNKNELLILTACLMGLNGIIVLIIPNIHRIDPKKYAADNKPGYLASPFQFPYFSLLCFLCLFILPYLEI